MTDCIPWLGALDRDGYGRIGSDLAHRRIYETSTGPIPEGREIDHICGRRDCVNPAHLEAVTHAQNIIRAIARRGPWQVKPRPEKCRNGHGFTPENTYVRPDGARTCRTCQREAVRAYKARRAA